MLEHPSCHLEDGEPHVRDIRDEWSRNRLDNGRLEMMDEGDVGNIDRRPRAGAASHVHDDTSGQPLDFTPSLGPWDSASQRSLPYHTPFSLAQPTRNPLSAGDTRNLRDQSSYAGGLGYVDEEGAYHRSQISRPVSALLENEDMEMHGLVRGAADFGASDDDELSRGTKYAEYDTAPSPYPSDQKTSSYLSQPDNLYTLLLFPTGLDRLLAMFGVKSARFPVEQAVERKRRGIGGQRWPIASWSLAVGESRLRPEAGAFLIGTC